MLREFPQRLSRLKEAAQVFPLVCSKLISCLLDLNILKMHVGVVAFNVLKIVPPSEMRALGILLTGYMFQGNQSLSDEGRYPLIHRFLRLRVSHESVLHWDLYFSVRDPFAIPHTSVIDGQKSHDCTFTTAMGRQTLKFIILLIDRFSGWQPNQQCVRHMRTSRVYRTSICQPGRSGPCYVGASVL